MKEPMIGMWKGVRVDQMTLDQARDAIYDMGRALNQVAAEKHEMVRRNMLLRNRPDLPIERIQGYMAIDRLIKAARAVDECKADDLDATKVLDELREALNAL